MRCHLCSVWSALFSEPPRPLALRPETCRNCRGHPPVRETVRRAIALQNPALGAALVCILDPLADPEAPEVEAVLG